MMTPTTFDLITLLRQQIVEVEQEHFAWRCRLRRMLEAQRARLGDDALEAHARAQAIARQELQFLQEKVQLLSNIIACNDLASVDALNAASPIRRKAAEARVQQNMTMAVAEGQRRADQAKSDTSHELYAVEVTEKRAASVVTFKDESFVL